ncbi:peptidylprolyl isomerase [Bacillus shivajii]|uniref:peptidylprolyl isomerase n=1 Tax=Bacillus shivajii TaxID=1983719 RepID=UPI001CF9DECC|nr:peptidylprolyl isomerase [Bacillus shivajii]UCZ51568.1 peptidylprolyl isomerase [Bacillus shivajii]
MNKNKMIMLLLSVTLLIGLAACGEESGQAQPDEFPQLEEGVAENEREAVIKTNKGDIHVKLFPEYAPKAVENFLSLSEEGYYDGVIFHRVIEDFMIQGGDPTGTGTGGESIYGEPFEDEFTEALTHLKGALAMANSGPNTNGSQFYIVQNEAMDRETLDMIMDQYNLELSEEIQEQYLERGGTPHLDPGHTVFGHVIGGMDVVDEIAQVETEMQDRPAEDVVIETVEVIE